MDQTQEIQTLKTQVEELMKWKKDKEENQLTFPLDDTSLNILRNEFLSKIGEYSFSGGAIGNEFTNLIIEQAQRKYMITTYGVYYTITVDTVNNIIRVGGSALDGSQGTFSDGQQVIVYSTDSMPSPLVQGTSYYVVNADSTGKNIQLSATSGGSAIDLTTVGSGSLFIIFFT